MLWCVSCINLKFNFICLSFASTFLIQFFIYYIIYAFDICDSKYASKSHFIQLILLIYFSQVMFEVAKQINIQQKQNMGKQILEFGEKKRIQWREKEFLQEWAHFWCRENLFSMFYFMLLCLPFLYCTWRKWQFF